MAERVERMPSKVCFRPAHANVIPPREQVVASDRGDIYFELCAVCEGFAGYKDDVSRMRGWLR